MIYRCKNCDRFLAEITGYKNFEIRKAKKIEIIDKTIKITCRCGNIEEIKKGD